MCECTRTAGTGTAPVEGVPLTIYDQMLAYSLCRSYKMGKKIKKPTQLHLSYLHYCRQERRRGMRRQSDFRKTPTWCSWTESITIFPSFVISLLAITLLTFPAEQLCLNCSSRASFPEMLRLKPTWNLGSLRPKCSFRFINRSAFYGEQRCLPVSVMRWNSVVINNSSSFLAQSKYIFIATHHYSHKNRVE